MSAGPPAPPPQQPTRFLQDPFAAPRLPTVENSTGWEPYETAPTGPVYGGAQAGGPGTPSNFGAGARTLPDGRPLAAAVAPPPTSDPNALPTPMAAGGPPSTALLQYGAQPTATPNPNPAWMGTRFGNTDDSGNQRPGLSQLGRLLAQRRSLQNTDPRQKVDMTNEGVWEGAPPPTGGHSKRHQALVGLLQGMAMTGDRGLPGLIGGGATGAAIGAASPRMVEAFTRDQELKRNEGDIGTEQGIEMKQGQLADIYAQAAQRQQQPELDWYRFDEAQRRNDALDADRAADNRRADASLKERANYHTGMLNKPGAATEEIEVGGRKFKVPPATAARILESRRTAGDKPNPRREAEIEAELEGENEKQHLAARKSAEERASQLRADREKLTHKSVQNTDGSWGWAESPALVKKNATQIADIDRQIRDSETEARDRQRDADAAIVRKNKATAKAQSAGEATTRKYSKYAGRSISRTNLATFAANEGMSVEEAEAALTAAGAKVKP